MKGILRRSQSQKLPSTAKSHFLSLLGCSLILALGSGCQVFNDLGDAWHDYEQEHQNDPSPNEAASGVDVMNCIVTNPPAKLGYSYSVFWRLNEEPTWHQFIPPEVQPLAPDQSCYGTDMATLEAYGAVTHLTFNQAGTWHIRWIVNDFGDAYGQVGQCNSNDGTASGCSQGQVGDIAFDYDASAPVKPIQL